MSNADTQATWAYHDGTKHSSWSIRSGPHSLDWANQPLPFKIYTGLDPIPLPRQLAPSEAPALAAISALDAFEGERVPDLPSLARLLHFSAGITKRIKVPAGEMQFRAASCTGALYHIELYLVSGPMPDLEAGVYQFGPHDFALRRLRSGDHRGVLVEATAGEPAVAQAPAILVLTSVFWRNAWKYRARAYRHAFWDSGVILANLLAVAAVDRVPARLVMGFQDQPVNDLLSLDTQREVSLALVPLGRASKSTAGPLPEFEALALETRPYSRTEVDYPEIRAMHEASSLVDSTEVKGWRGDTPLVQRPEPQGTPFPLDLPSHDETPEDAIEEVIVRRGSSRSFVREAITFRQLSTILHRATQGIPADFLGVPGASLNDLYLIVNAVEGLPPGTYVYNRDAVALEQLKEGDFRKQAGFLDLQQQLSEDASVNIYLLSDLKSVLERYGNRGYRAAQMEASIIGGKLYLGAYAHRMGATGLTFFDDDVTDFFSPHAAGKSVMFLMALGVSARRRPV